MKTLVTGAVRSGKSVVAERLLGREPHVLYVACGRTADSDEDPEWAARVATHQERRPLGWSTAETTSLPALLAAASTPVLVDCLGTWLTAQLDELHAWSRPTIDWETELTTRVSDLTAAVAGYSRPLVLVTNEVGWGLVSEHASGRLFADRLGWVNQRVAAVCDEVQLVVAGRTITL